MFPLSLCFVRFTVNQKLRAMVKAKDAPSDASTETTPDEFVALSLVKWHMKMYPTPVSLANPQYVVAPETWPYLLLHLRIPWSDIQTHHATPGPLTLALPRKVHRLKPCRGSSGLGPHPSGVGNQRSLLGERWAMAPRLRPHMNGFGPHITIRSSRPTIK